MSSATFQAAAPLRTSFAELIQGARAFAAALFAAQERQFVPQEIMVKPPRAARWRLRDHMALISLANEYQDMQPSLAAELRQLASRG